MARREYDCGNPSHYGARGAQEGILIKNAEALERLEKVDILVVDKTGTLTEGKRRLTKIVPSLDINEKVLLAAAASIEQGSEHPLAAAIVAAAKERSVELNAAEDFESHTGGGVVGKVDGKEVAIGSLRFLQERGINGAEALEAATGQLQAEGQTTVFVAMESAGVTLVKGDLRGIAKAVALSKATMRNIRQNLFFAFIYNALGIPIAAGLLYPFFGVLLSPIIAGAAMSLSSVSVIANALRLRATRL
jgi:cation transport ATPase